MMQRAYTTGMRRRGPAAAAESRQAVIVILHVVGLHTIQYVAVRFRLYNTEHWRSNKQPTTRRRLLAIEIGYNLSLLMAEN